jgi:hypothetical protein
MLIHAVLFMTSLSKLRENLLTIYGAGKEFLDIVFTLFYLIIKSIICRISPKTYNILTPLRAKLSIQSRRK